jgi:hypothetical protein
MALLAFEKTPRPEMLSCVRNVLRLVSIYSDVTLAPEDIAEIDEMTREIKVVGARLVVICERFSLSCLLSVIKVQRSL